MDATPAPTLYCRNLDDRVHVNDLKANLFEFFIPHGEIIAIEARVTKKMRGQAFVVFRDVNAAIAALRKQQGKTFMGKPIVIEFARKKSDATAHLDGTYRPRKRNIEQTGATGDNTTTEAPAKVMKQAESTK